LNVLPEVYIATFLTVADLLTPAAEAICEGEPPQSPEMHLYVRFAA